MNILDSVRKIIKVFVKEKPQKISPEEVLWDILSKNNVSEVVVDCEYTGPILEGLDLSFKPKYSHGVIHEPVSAFLSKGEENDLANNGLPYGYALMLDDDACWSVKDLFAFISEKFVAYCDAELHMEAQGKRIYKDLTLIFDVKKKSVQFEQYHKFSTDAKA